MRGNLSGSSGASSAELCAFVVFAFVSVCVALAAPLVAIIAVTAAASIAAAILSIRSIRWAWSIYFFALCANGVQVTVGGFTVRPEYIATPLFLLALHAYAGREPGARAPSPFTVGLIIGSVGLVSVGLTSSMLFAPDTAASLRMAVQLIAALIVVIPLTRVALDHRFVVRSGTAILSAISTFSVASFLLDPSTRVDGLAFEYNIMGCLCAGWIGVLYYFAGDRAVVTQRVLMLAAPIPVALILTSTRAAWIALAVIAVCVMVRCAARYPVAIVCSLVAFTVGFAYLHDVYYRVGDADTFLWRVVHVIDTESGTGAYRLQLWNTAVEQIADRDWSAAIGTGFNSFSQFNPVDPTNVGAAYLSSMWLTLIYDVGFFGFAFFVVLMVSLFLGVRHKKHALPLFVALAICTSVTNVIWFAFPWVFMALTVTAPRTGSSSASAADDAHGIGHPRQRRRHRAVATS
ncbi:O-antigen ligase family protein [Rhodococcus sp. IEGM 1330]|uniref:O-antigen ligase family protein n=1 Tax=Rhodococcus sp. IEGM 1330 TaxID=3082225 RepID=UPI0029555E2F|nr:O-antigen ligase family protein [Rhodococcus sp. IEGM 1330]MDV8023644.1 O-antigen ligase family protein [Rhodococcus sp. IEGM 1330]